MVLKIDVSTGGIDRHQKIKKYQNSNETLCNIWVTFWIQRGSWFDIWSFLVLFDTRATAFPLTLFRTPKTCTHNSTRNEKTCIVRSFRMVTDAKVVASLSLCSPVRFLFARSRLYFSLSPCNRNFFRKRGGSLMNTNDFRVHFQNVC